MKDEDEPKRHIPYLLLAFILITLAAAIIVPPLISRNLDQIGSQAATPVSLQATSQGPKGTLTVTYPDGHTDTASLEQDQNLTFGTEVGQGQTVTIAIDVDSPAEGNAACRIATSQSANPLVEQSLEGAGTVVCTWTNS